MADITHSINWFEIPVSDFERAKKFYETILAFTMKVKQAGNAQMGFFEHDPQDDGRGGAIVHDPEFYTPSANGTLVYLNCEPHIQEVLDRITTAGGGNTPGQDCSRCNTGYGLLGAYTGF